MAIPKFNSYDSVKPYGDYQPLPTGAYILKILNAKVKENEIGKYIDISLDIADGEFKDYFMEDYQKQDKEDKKWHCHYLLNVPKDDGTEQDGWAARKFRTFTAALEDSNEDYHFDWDEEKFKDKLVGGLFNIREYKKEDGSVGQVTNLAQVCNVNKIRSGNYKLPKDKLISGEAARSSAATDSDEFMNVPDGSTDELLFD